VFVNVEVIRQGWDLHGFVLDYKQNKFKGVVDYDFTFLSLLF